MKSGYYHFIILSFCANIMSILGLALVIVGKIWCMKSTRRTVPNNWGQLFQPMHNWKGIIESFRVKGKLNFKFYCILFNFCSVNVWKKCLNEFSLATASAVVVPTYYLIHNCALRRYLYHITACNLGCAQTPCILQWGVIQTYSIVHYHSGHFW